MNVRIKRFSLTATGALRMAKEINAWLGKLHGTPIHIEVAGASGKLDYGFVLIITYRTGQKDEQPAQVEIFSTTGIYARDSLETQVNSWFEALPEGTDVIGQDLAGAGNNNYSSGYVYALLYRLPA